MLNEIKNQFDLTEQFLFKFKILRITLEEFFKTNYSCSLVILFPQQILLLIQSVYFLSIER